MSSYGAFAAQCLDFMSKEQWCLRSCRAVWTSDHLKKMANFKRLCHCKYEDDLLHVSSVWQMDNLWVVCLPTRHKMFICSPAWTQKRVLNEKHVFSWLQFDLWHLILTWQHANDDYIEYPQSPTRQAYFICCLVCMLSAFFFMTLRSYSQSPLNLQLILVLM